MTSGSKIARASTAWRKNLYDMAPNDSFIVSNNSKTGIALRDDVGESTGSETYELPHSQTVSLALNEYARKHYGVGKFFWIASRQMRQASADQGYCRNGPDLVYIPWVWSDIDNHLYDSATPYERLRLTNAWTCLSPGDIVLSIFNSHSKPMSKQTFPSPIIKAGVTSKYDFGTVSVLILWDDFPNMAYLEHVKGIKLSNRNPQIPANARRAHRVRTLDLVLKKAYDGWWSKKPNGDSRIVSMEEVYADALLPGPRKNQTLALITWRSKQGRQSQSITSTSVATSSTAHVSPDDNDDDDDEEDDNDEL